MQMAAIHAYVREEKERMRVTPDSSCYPLPEHEPQNYASHLRTVVGCGERRTYVHSFWCARQVTIRFMIFFRLIRGFAFLYSHSSQYVANRETNALIVLEI